MRNATTRGHKFTLSEDEAFAIFASLCFYCGAAPANISDGGRGVFGSFTYSGIDRIDSDYGYTPENVRPCCKMCNTAKHNYSVGVFLAWARRLVEHQAAQCLTAAG